MANTWFIVIRPDAYIALARPLRVKLFCILKNSQVALITLKFLLLNPKKDAYIAASFISNLN